MPIHVSGSGIGHMRFLKVTDIKWRQLLSNRMVSVLFLGVFFPCPEFSQSFLIPSEMAERFLLGYNGDFRLKRLQYCLNRLALFDIIWHQF